MWPGLGFAWYSEDEPEPPTRQAKGFVEAYQELANRCLYMDLPPNGSQIGTSWPTSYDALAKKYLQ